MLTWLRMAVHRFAVRQHLQDIAYLTSDRQLRATLRRTLTGTCRRGVISSWSTRTTAGIVASIWIAQLARGLEPERRMRIGRQIVDQERAGVTALNWLAEFNSDRMNVVGMDVFLLRFNAGSGTLAAWIAEGRSIDPGVHRIFLAMAAWGLAGVPEDEVEARFEEALEDISG